jgi:hypothetical protein
MPFQLTPAMIQSAAQSGATYADSVAPIIRAADEARRDDLIERAIAGLRKGLLVAITEMRFRGATEVDAREFEDAASFSFSDRIVELLNEALPSVSWQGRRASATPTQPKTY